MRITKYEHATVVLDKDGESLIIDPGTFLASLTEIPRTSAIVLTHQHEDHWSPRTLDQILATNPGIPIFGPAGVAAAATGYDITVVAPGDTVQAGNAAAVVESVKAASDVYSPVSGTVVEVNEALADKPETINEDAYGEGWLFVVEMSEAEQVNELLGPDDYAELLENDDH